MIEIKEVIGKKMLKQFIEFPVKLYKGNEYFTPYLYEDEVNNLTPEKNPASKYCIFKPMLAYKDGVIVGRICAIISNFANEKYNQKRVRFNRIDMIDDIEVTRALIKAVEEYGIEHGMTEICGPLGYSDQDKEGLLTYGFDQKNMFATFYTHPYYVDHLKQLGFVEDAKWFEYKIPVPDPINPKFLRIADYAENMYGLRVERLKNKRNLGPTIIEVLSLTNKCYADLYEYVPIDQDQMMALADQYVPLINTKYLYLVRDKENKLVAFGLMIPTPVNALKKHNGHLFPFGWISFLHALKTEKVLDMLLVAVDPAYRRQGAAALFLREANKICLENKIKYAETGPTLEDNAEIQALWKGFNAEHHKTRVCFIKPIENQ